MKLMMMTAAATALGAAVVGGVFFAFSTFVMGALGTLPGAQGAAAMRAINVVVLRSLLMPVMFGTAALCLGVAVVATRRWSTPGSGWLAMGAGLYLLGVIGVTMFGNVPLNDALAHSDGDAGWRQYLRAWLLWNHARALTGVLAAASLLAGMFSARS